MDFLFFKFSEFLSLELRPLINRRKNILFVSQSINAVEKAIVLLIFMNAVISDVIELISFMILGFLKLK